MSQCADAIQKLLEREIEGILTPAQLCRLAARLANDINLTQARNREAREAATRKRVAELRERGYDSLRLPLCDWTEVAL